MKRTMMILLALFVILLTLPAAAQSLVDNDYTDVSTAMTQDSVLEIGATEGCSAQVLQPDDRFMALLDDIYRFVWLQKNRPARYYDEATQQKITELIGGVNIDVLHLTEAMSMQLDGETEKSVTVRMLMDVDYRVGQLIVAVLGLPQEDGSYLWYPYRGRVESVGEIKWDIPAEEWEALCGRPISLHILSDRLGAAGQRLWHEEAYTERIDVFSKDSSDVNQTRRWYTESGAPIADDFAVWLADLTKPMNEEIVRLGGHVMNGDQILDYMPEERRAEALLMLPEDIDPATLIPYDIIAVRCDNYKDSYGDVNVVIIFGTDYDADKAMIILGGFPIGAAEEAPFMEWYVLRTEALEVEEGAEDENAVLIGLKQLNLSRMMDEPMMLVVISEPVDQE
ncbi:MAG: hypothetical protein IJ343_13875 [Clostridia bacterium]|nr:hypothetical protein [Clostridia bacterium]